MSSSASAESTNCQSHCFAFTSSAFFSPQLLEFKNPKPTNTDPADTRGQLCFPIVYKGLEHPWILGSLDGGGGGCSWNQFPMNAEGCLYLFCFLGVRGHWVKIPALPRISSKLLPSLPRRPSLCSSHCKTWGIKDLGRDKWPHLEAGEAQPCSFTHCFHTPAH